MAHVSNSRRYNDYLIHETMRVAILDMIQDKNGDSKSLPEGLRKIMKTHFLNHYSFYERTIHWNIGTVPEKKSWFSSSSDAGMFGIRYTPMYKTLKARLESVKSQVEYELSRESLLSFQL